MPFDPAGRVLSSAIKRSYSQHATQPLPRAQNTSPPPAKRRRHKASSGASSFSSPHPTSKYDQLTTHVNNLKSFKRPSNSSPKQPSISSKRSKKALPPKTVLPGPYHSQAYVEKEHNKSVVPLKQCHKETPKSSVNNFYQGLYGNGKRPNFTTIDGDIFEGEKQIYAHR